MSVSVCVSVCSPGQTHSTMLLPVKVRYSTVQSQHIHKRVYTTALETLLDHAGCFFFSFFFSQKDQQEQNDKRIVGTGTLMFLCYKIQ